MPNDIEMIYHSVVIISTFLMFVAYATANHQHMGTISLEMDKSNWLLRIKTFAVKMFIPIFVFIALFYVIISLFLHFSLFHIGFLVIIFFLRKKIKSAYASKEPVHEFFERIKGDSYLVDILMLYVGVGTFFQSMYDLITCAQKF